MSRADFRSTDRLATVTSYGFACCCEWAQSTKSRELDDRGELRTSELIGARAHLASIQGNGAA